MDIQLSIQNITAQEANRGIIKVGVVLAGDIGDTIYVIEPGKAETITLPEGAGLLVEEVSQHDLAELAPEPPPDVVTFLEVAKKCHTANRYYSLSMGADPAPFWDELPQDRRESILSGVNTVYYNPAITPEGLHLSWLMHKAAQGWTYGEAIDLAEKTHPCMVPFEALPEADQRKDEIFITVAKEGFGYHEHATGAVAV